MPTQHIKKARQRLEKLVTQPLFPSDPLWEEEMRLTAEVIEHNAQTMAAEILKRHKARNDENKPLFVINGETHHIAAHYLQEMRMVEILQMHDLNIVQGIEQETNLWVNYFDLLTEDLDFTSDQNNHAKSILNKSPQNSDDALAMISIGCWTMGHVAKKLRMNFLQTCNILVKFNDSAMTPDRMLDYNDPSTKIAIDSQYPHLSKTLINYLDINGMHIRNIMMREAAEDHASKTKPDIYIQHCGNSHVAGDIMYKHPFKKSLLHSFNKAGHAPLALAVFEQGFTPDRITKQAQANHGLMMNTHTPARSFFYDREDAAEYGCFNDRHDETVAIFEIMTLLGMNTKLLNDTLKAEIQAIAQRRTLFADIIQQCESIKAPSPS